MFDLEAAVAQKAQERAQRVAQGETQMRSSKEPKATTPVATNPMALQVSQKAQEREARLANGGEQRLTQLAPEPEAKEDAKNVFLEAAQLGRLTRLNEHIVEAVAVEKTPHEEWRSKGLLAHVNIQRQHLLVIREAARAGALQKLPENVVANYNNASKSSSLRLQQIERDRANAQIMNTVGTAHLKMDQVIQSQKKTHQINQLTNDDDDDNDQHHVAALGAAGDHNDTIVHSRVYYESFDLSQVQLPKDHLPKIDPAQNLLKLQQDAQKRRWKNKNSNTSSSSSFSQPTSSTNTTNDRPMSNICSDVAKRANARRNRLNWPGSKPRVRQDGCQCPWCQKASPFQTYAYKQKEFIEKALERQRLENERLAELKKQRDQMLLEEEAEMRKLYYGDTTTTTNSTNNPAEEDDDEWEDAENREPAQSRKAPPRTASTNRRSNKRGGGRRGSILAIFSSQNMGRNNHTNDDDDDNSSVQSDGTELGLGAELRRAARKQKPRVVNRRGSLMGFRASWNQQKKAAQQHPKAANTDENDDDDDAPSVASSQNPSEASSQKSLGAQIRSTAQKRKPRATSRRGSLLGLVGGWGKKNTENKASHSPGEPSEDDNDDDDPGTGLGAEIKRAARQRKPQQVSRRGSLLGMFGRGKQQSQTASTDDDEDDGGMLAMLQKKTDQAAPNNHETSQDDDDGGMLAVLQKKQAADESKSNDDGDASDDDGGMLAVLQRKQASEQSATSNQDEEDDGGMLAVLQKKQLADEGRSGDGSTLPALKKSGKHKRSKRRKKKSDSGKEMLDYMKEAQETNNTMLAHLRQNDQASPDDGEDSMMAHLNRTFQEDIGVSKSSDKIDYNAESQDEEEVEYGYGDDEPRRRENHIKLDVSQDYGYEVDEVQDYDYEPQGVEDYGYGDAVPDNAAAIDSEEDEEQKAKRLEKEAEEEDEKIEKFYDQKNLMFKNGIFYGFKMPDYSKEKPSEPSPPKEDEDGWVTEAELRPEEGPKKKKKKGWFKRKKSKSKNKNKSNSKEAAAPEPTKRRGGNRRGSILAVFGMASAAEKKGGIQNKKESKSGQSPNASPKKSKSSVSPKKQKSSKKVGSPRKTTEIVPASQWGQQNRRGSLTVSYGWSRTGEDGDKTDFFFAPSITPGISDPSTDSSRSPIRTNGTSKIRAAALKMQQLKEKESQVIEEETKDHKQNAPEEDVAWQRNSGKDADSVLLVNESGHDQSTSEETKGDGDDKKAKKRTKLTGSKKTGKNKKNASNSDEAETEGKVLEEGMEVGSLDTDAMVSANTNDESEKDSHKNEKPGKPPKAPSKGKSHRRSKSSGDDKSINSSSTTNTLKSTRRGGKKLKKNKSSGDLEGEGDPNSNAEEIAKGSRSKLRRSKGDPETSSSKDKKKHKSSKRKKSKSLKHSTHSAESRISTDLSSDDFSLGVSGHSMAISLGDTVAQELDSSESHDGSERLGNDDSEKDFAEDERIDVESVIEDTIPEETTTDDNGDIVTQGADEEPTGKLSKSSEQDESPPIIAEEEEILQPQADGVKAEDSPMDTAVEQSCEFETDNANIVLSHNVQQENEGEMSTDLSPSTSGILESKTDDLSQDEVEKVYADIPADSQLPTSSDEQDNLSQDEGQKVQADIPADSQLPTSSDEQGLAENSNDTESLIEPEEHSSADDERVERVTENANEDSVSQDQNAEMSTLPDDEATQHIPSSANTETGSEVLVA